MDQRLIVTDLCRNQSFLSLFNKTLVEIQKGNDELKDNYANLTPDDFASLTFAVRNGQALAFSGMEISAEKWGANCARVSSKFYIPPAFRHTHLQKFEPSDKYINSTYLIPRQIAVAQSLGIECVFISRIDKRRSFGKFIDLVNANGGYNFKMYPHKLGVCGPLPLGYRPAECCQWIATMPLKKDADTKFLEYLENISCEDCNDSN